MDGDVVDLINRDHREVERLFWVLKDCREERISLLPVLTALLTSHARAEEAEIYPVAASEAGHRVAVLRGQVWHLRARQLLVKLAGADPNRVAFEEELLKLVDVVCRHLGEEEAEILPLLARLSEERRTELGAAFVATRNQDPSEQPRRDRTHSL